MRQCFKIGLLLTLFLTFAIDTWSCSAYPDEIGDKARYEMMIEMPKAYVSGILVVAKTGPEMISASLVNEFGFSLIDFTFDEKKQKVKLVSVTKELDKWYIKRTLRSDLKQVMTLMKEGEEKYIDKKHKIDFTFRLLNDSAE